MIIIVIVVVIIIIRDIIIFNHQCFINLNRRYIQFLILPKNKKKIIGKATHQNSEGKGRRSES